MNTILVLTALELERKAVLEHLENIQDELHPETKTDYKIGYYNSPRGKIKVVAGITDQTNVNAGIETERALAHFSPTHACFVGVAGGLKDVKVGDIVIGDTVYGYERGKETDKGFLFRPEFALSSYDLVRIANSYGSSEEWKQKTSSLINDEFSDPISVFMGTIAAGEKVMTNIDSDTLSFIRTHVSSAYAIEMEGLGFLEACRHFSNVKSLLLRGISDLIKGKDGADEKGSQTYASKNVSAFLFGVIDKIFEMEIVPPNYRESLQDICQKLYPRGIESRDIWEKAGGYVYEMNLNKTGGEQWYEALKYIENGGRVTFPSLIKAMKEDFPNHELLKTLS